MPSARLAALAIAGFASSACPNEVIVLQAEGDPCVTVAPIPGTQCALTGVECTRVEGPCEIAAVCTLAPWCASNPDVCGAYWQDEDTTCEPAAVACAAASPDDVCAVQGETCTPSGECLRVCDPDHHWTFGC